MTQCLSSSRLAPGTPQWKVVVRGVQWGRWTPCGLPDGALVGPVGPLCGDVRRDGFPKQEPKA